MGHQVKSKGFVPNMELVDVLDSDGSEEAERPSLLTVHQHTDDDEDTNTHYLKGRVQTRCCQNSNGHDHLPPHRQMNS